MERHGKYFDAVRYKGHSGLVLHHQESVESVVNEINEIVQNAQRKGYNNDEKWIIISVEWGKTWTEDNAFLGSWEKRTAVALYDNGTVSAFPEAADSL